MLQVVRSISYQPKSVEILLGDKCPMWDSCGPPAETHAKWGK